jgi:transposase
MQSGESPEVVARALGVNRVTVYGWLARYRDVQSLARRYKAQIFFGDEAGVSSEHHGGRTWAPKGKTPVVSTTGARLGLNMISAVSAQGEFRFMTVEGRIGASVFIEFIKRLIHGTDRMIFLIVDGHPAHRAKIVKKFIERKEIRKRFRLFFPPPYSPELNPGERVWNDLKNNGVGRKVITSPEQLKA